MFLPRSRTQNVYTQDGRPRVAKVPHLNGDYLPESLRTALDLLGGLDKAVHSGDRVMVKPNFNCSYATPLSTDLAFLSAAIEILTDAGAQVVVGELSGKAAWPTEAVVESLGVLPVLARYGVKFVNFEYDQWLPMEVNGRHWATFRVPKTIYEVDKRVYLANMRCHNSARFSASLKLGVGWIDLQDRDFLHADRNLVEEKVAELHLGWQPNLVLIDGRRSTAAWSGRGEYIYPNVVMASGDMVAIDSEAVKVLQGFPAENGLKMRVEEMGQLKHAHELGLGSLDYMLIAAPMHTQTVQENIAVARF